ncbi:expressed conserved protein [Echinococcus multilocularis]|uniref:Expressed conserved protein n=1 Tax=Echinococcus multilocularis TaxID=6211 RepID=A0A087W134_ECHMU|nr:expressed conserved protein [Echinococcus multilocularis]
MRSHSILVYHHLLLLLLIFLLAFASHRAAAAVVPDSEVARKLEADLFEVPDHAEGEEVTEEMENLEEEGEELAEGPDETDRQGSVLISAGWRRIRRSIRRRIRNIFRKPRRICFPYCPKGPKKGREN